jgi:hypothetical protein
MAVIKYQINGKADTKPIKATEAAAQGMFKKINDIDNKLKAFVGIKVFNEVGKAVKNALAEYDKFQESINGENNLTKQFDKIKTTLSGTLGTIRDKLFDIISDITGKDGFKVLEEIIPKIGANLIASLNVAKEIVINIKDNFETLTKPEAWNDFFSHAKDLGSSFVAFLRSLLVDAFKYSLEVFKWSFGDMNLPKLLWNGMSEFAKNFYELMGLMGKVINPAVEQYFNNLAAQQEAGKFGLGPLPAFQVSDETKNELGNIGAELGKTFKSAFSTLAGRPVDEIFDEAYSAAYEKINATITAMNDDTDLVKVLEELKASLKPQASSAVSEATAKFSNATSYIEGILGTATEEQAEKIRKRMEGLNKQFATATEKVTDLFDELEKAESATKVEEIFKKINIQVGKMNELSEDMTNLDKTTGGANSQIEKILSLFGDIGIVISAIMLSNPIGLLIDLAAKLISSFAKISGPFSSMLKIFDVFFDVVEDICAVLEPALGVIFKPVLDVVQSAARVFGMLMNFLMPIVSIISLVLFPILKAVQGLFYSLGWVLAALADGVAWAYNGISEVVSKLTFGVLNMGTLATNNKQKIEEAGVYGEGNYDEYKNSNNSTSYSVAGDMYININFDHSFVNGDTKEIAIMLRDEIRILEGQGY